jgi:iron(III) transport system substrate-binding protein
VVAVFASILVAGCADGEPEVVVYTSVDQVYAEPLLADFEEETGVRVRAVYDAEAAKTTALVNRLVAERDRPRADVWWSGEIVQTLSLAEEGVLAPYAPENADDIPETFKDPDELWTAFGGRARIILVNTEADVAEPESVDDLTDPEGRWEMSAVGMADPRFGTTATHGAVLYALLGPDRARAYYETVAARGVQILDGNGAVRDAVADGSLVWGMTDTDDALGSIDRGDPVRIVVPDQGEGQPGALLIPNSVALVAGGPDPESGKRLIEWLLDPATEQRLVDDGWIQFPVRGMPDPRLGEPPRFMEADYEAAFGMLETSQSDMTDIFAR